MRINIDRVKELTTTFSEPTWLADSRLEAWEAYLQTPMPTGRDEDWRRTDLGVLDLTRLRASNFGALKEGSTQLPPWFEAAAAHFPSRAGALYQSTVSGASVTLSAGAQKQGVIFCDIATAIESHADKIRPLLLESAEKGKFTLLTSALFNCGSFLYIPRNVQIAEPFIFALDFVGQDDADDQGAAIFPRIFVVVEDNSSADFVLMMASPAGAPRASNVSLASVLADFHLKPGSKLNYLEVQDFAQDVFYVEHLNSKVDKDASFNSLCVALGGKQTKADIATYLRGPGANSSVLGAVLGSDNEKFSYNTIQEHNSPDTTSDINFRVAVKDTSASVYQGIIRVDKIAQRTNAFQSNKNLLLSGEAKADSIPKLEILADDVKCSHGATVGPVDREQLFYLRSRGLTPMEAEELIVLGFFRQVFEQFPITAAREWLTEVVSTKIYRTAAAASAVLKGK